MMIATATADSRAFMNLVRPALETADAATVAQVVLDHWKPQQISSLLTESDVNVRRVCALVLGLVGDATTVEPLAQALHDEDSRVNELGQDALWSVWFRLGTRAAARSFREGMNLLGQNNLQAAILNFRQAIAADQNFAEAANQCAIAHFLLGQWRQSLAFCQRAMDLMPYHFGAASGLGHCYMYLGDLDAARQWYCQALQINPRMPIIEDACRCLAEEFGRSKTKFARQAAG